MEHSRFTYLLGRYEAGATSDAETAELLALFADPVNDAEIGDLLVGMLEQTQPDAWADAERWQPVIDRILGREEQGRGVRERRVSSLIWLWQWATVAAVVAIVAAGIWLLWRRPGEREVVINNAPAGVIAPGGNKAVLTLGNGQQIVLDSAANGLIAQQGGTRVSKTDSGRLAYAGGENGTGAAVLYNTLTTPRGGQYQLRLADGTRVWLNAVSSIRYPTTFPGDRREVEVNGEAYFQVVHDARRPFIVKTRDSLEVEVLGTDFDLLDYPDEPELRTTLLRGAVRVRKGASIVILAPGDQARIGSKGEATTGGTKTGGTRIDVVHSVDTGAVIAWVGGYFEFRNIDLAQLMRQVGRWYDVQITYDVPYRSLRPMRFGGRTSRNLSLGDLIEILEKIGVRLGVEGRTVHVLANSQ